MNFAIWSIRHPIPSILFFVLMTMAGFYGFKKLSIETFPSIDLPAVNIALTLPGAAPSQLETEVARQVENALAALTGVKHIRTSITDGLVSINVSFELNTLLSDALMETKDAVDSVRSELPLELNAPIIRAVRIGSNPLITYAVQSTQKNEETLSWFVDDTISKTLLAIKGVGRFERVGGVDREIEVNVDPAKLAAIGVTTADISHSLRQAQMEYASGRTQAGQQEQSIRTIGTVKQASDLNALPLSLADGRMIQLDQVATILDSHAEHTQAELLDGKTSVGFRIYNTKGFDEIKTVEAAQQAVKKLQATYPDLKITPVFSTVDNTLHQYQSSMEILYEGALLAVIVVWFFLRDWRATLISATALPLSIIPTFAIMYWLGFSLNSLTLLALAVVVGILVDDAIVEIENIVRFKRIGKSVRQATEEAVTEIALAVIATTLTLVMVFLPTSIMSGISGLLFRQFGWTLVISVLFSLLVARLLIPILAVAFLKPETHQGHVDGKIMLGYLSIVKRCLNHRKATMIGATFFFILSIALLPFLPVSFIPPSDIGYTFVNFELPPGSTLQNSITTAERIRKALAATPGVLHVFTTIGNPKIAGIERSQGGEVRKGTLILTLRPRYERASQIDIENTIRKKLREVPGARFTVGTGGPGEKLSILLSSDHQAALTMTANNVVHDLRALSTLSNISSTATLERPEMIIRPLARRAAELGINTQTIGDTVRIATTGDFDTQLSRLNLEDRQVYIRVRLAKGTHQDINTISALRIPTKNGQTLLGNVTDITYSTSPSQIDRYDRHRYVIINADLGGMPLGQALAAVKQSSAIKNKPSNVLLLDTGDTEFMTEFFNGFGIAMLTGILCIFCVLVLLFNDFFQPITILSALPLSIGGVIFSLLLTKQHLSLPALIGIVMLMGIVTKNSILLVECTIVGMRDHGLSQYDALIKACYKRARPIVMTTTAMMAGMLPIALKLGDNSSFRQPMAIAVMGGLLTSTVLSLLVVPIIFTYIHEFACWVQKKRLIAHLIVENKNN